MNRYIGTDPQLVYAQEDFGTVDQRIGELADISCDFEIVICGGKGENVQLLELINLLQGNVIIVDEARFLTQPPARGPRCGKGQRKANRADRWK